MKCFRDRRWVSEFRLILSLAITLLPLFVPTLSAQEIVDPRSGQLFLSVTDLAVQGGPVMLEIRRSLQSGQRQPGLLGSRWRLNWESRLVRAGSLVLIEESTGSLSFSQQGPVGEYRSALGDRLVVDKTGHAIRTKPDGTKVIFDAQGRLVERDFRNGNRVVLSYGSEGRLSKIEGPHGSFLRFTIDKTGRMTQVEASTTATVRYLYQGNELTEVQRPPAPPIRYSYFTGGQVARIEEPQFGTVQFAYDFNGRVSRRQWADGSKERYEYDDPTNTIRQIDPAGGVTTIRWSQDKRRAELTNPLGHKSVIISDAVGRPLQITGPTGASARLTYDALGRTMAMEIPAGQVTRFEYREETSHPSAILRPDGTRQLFEYDRRGNLTALTLGTETLAVFTYHPDGSVATAKGLGTPERRLSYDPAGRLTAVANALGETTRFAYDVRGNLTQETNPLGGVTRYQYDAQDRPVSRTDPVGGLTRYEYDPQGRLSRILDPLGGVTRYDYDARGRLVAETNPAGQATRYEYAVSGRLAAVLAPDGTTERFRYDALGNQTEWTDRLGRSTAFTYDPLGRLSREHGPTRPEIRYRYDALGNLVGAEDTTGSKGEFQRDPFGQLTAHVDPLGAVTRYQYDPLGNLLALTDPRGQSTRFAYTPEGRLAMAQEPSGDAARYEYDAARRLVVMHHPGGGVTRRAYDAMGNVTTVTDPLGNRIRHSYDLAGRRTSTTDALGRVTRYVYDRSGRLVEKQLPDGRRVTYQYDRLGNLVFADDGAFPIRRSYDPAGRLVRVEYPAIKKAVGYEYDGSGLRTKLIDPEGRATRYEYTIQKKLAAIIPPDGKRIGVTYDEKNRLQSIRYPNRISGRWEYDAAGRIARITYQDQNGTPVAGWTYRFDPAGNPVEQRDSQGRATSFQYDAAGQLVEEVGPGGAIRYRYLPGGNRATVEEGGTVTPYRHDAADRVIQAGQEQLIYDANGELVGRKGSAGAMVYEYDTEGRLVKAVGPDGTPTTFGYAPTGERVWKRGRSGLTYYLYNGLDLIEEVGETGTPMATYIHGPGVDRPLAMLRDGRAFYYHPDRLGTISLVTDDRGQVAATYEYDAFGKLRAQQGAVPNPFAFTGREWDASTGLYYYRARYYDAGLGRFLSPDPVPVRFKEPLTLNRYLYVRNNPVRHVDPLGLDGFDPMGLNVYDPAAFHSLTNEELAALESHYHNRQMRLENLQSRIHQRVPWDAPDAEGELWPRRPFTPTESARLNRWEGAAAAAEENAELMRRIQGYRSGAAPEPSGVPRGPTLPTRGPGGTIIEGPPPTLGNTLIDPTVEATIPGSGSRRVTVGGVVSGTLIVGVVIAGVTHIVTSDNPAQAAVEVAVGLSGGELGAVFGGALLGPPGAIVGGLIGGMVAACLASPCAGGGPIPYLTPEQPHATNPPSTTDPATTLSTPGSPVFGGTTPTTYVPLPPEKGPPAPTLIGPPGPHPFPADLPPSPLPPPGERSVDPSAPSGGETRPPFDALTGPGLPQGPGGSDIPGATEAGTQFQGQTPWGQPPGPTSGVTGGGQPIEQPGLKPPPTGPTEAGTPGQPPPQQGYWCYSKTTKEWYSIPYGPCPPSDMKPSSDPSSVRVPWQGLTPPPDTVAPTGGGCPPGCHMRPDGSGCHCPGGSPGKPSGGG